MKWFKKVSAFCASLLLLAGVVFVPQIASSGSARDCDGNAVIYCGAYSVSELNSKIANGTGQPYQSGAELTYLFTTFGYTAANAGSLQNGRVTKDNKVYIGNTLIASDVYSMGRHKTTHSFDIPEVGYPLWWRHPSESFISSSIDAYVLLNYDNSFRMAIIKSCGNIVPGTRKEQPLRYPLSVYKWNDIDGDAHKQADEPFLSGWQFRVVGPETDRVITTGTDGSATLTNLLAGTYTITEVLQPEWRATTAVAQNAVIPTVHEVYFGNQRIPQRIAVGIRVIKFNDINGSKTQESNEPSLAGWQFRVEGGKVNTVITTDSNGVATLTDLQPGRYTVTEINQEGWENTTGLVAVKDVTTDPATQTYIFGNREIEKPHDHPGGGETLPVSGPEDAALPIAGAMGMSGGIVAWIRSKKQLLAALKK